MSSSQFLRTPALTGTDVDAKRAEIAAYFNATWERYDSLFETMADDRAYYEKSIPLRHPLIFYYGHTATFYVNKLILTGLIEHRINPEFESMFAIGVDEMSWDDLDETHYNWPSVPEVTEYRRQVKELVNNLIKMAPLTLPIDWENPWWIIMMGIEHEQIHLETSSVLIRQQKLDYLQTHPSWEPCKKTGTAPDNEMIVISAGEVTIGKADDSPYYGWDNEYGSHTSEVDAFEASRYLVSNHEFLEFVDAGGYQQDSYWDDEGLKWRDFAKADKPTFWLKSEVKEKGVIWNLRLMAEVIEMPWDWPVEVNCLEAKAFCNWKAEVTTDSVRLPTEDEWYRMAATSNVPELKAGEQVSANLHLDHGASPCPVNQHRHGEIFDVVGNVWQWTGTAIYPFNGSKVHPCYDDFTMPTYDGCHNIFKGGSWISSGNESRLSSRYAFRRHFFQHAGFRYVIGDEPLVQPMSNYETDKMLSEYAEFHFGDSYFGVANFPKALAEIAIEAMGDKPSKKALDIGCAVGRSSFELAKHFDHVTGIDFSARLINLGVKLAKEGAARYSIADEGELVHFHERRLEDLGLDETCEKVEFFQGDACNLKPILTGYDLILAANLIDRLYDPMLFLATVHERMNVGGVLMIASPYTWLEEHTKKDDWLGGYKKDGENFTTLDGLKAALLPNFELLREPQQVPFVIRETSRKFQHSLSDVSLWVKRP